MNTATNLRRKKYLELLASLIFIIVSLLIVFLPFNKDIFSYQWNPNTDENEARLTLIEFEPNIFDLEIPCELIASTNDWIFEARGGEALQIAIFNEEIIILLGSEDSDKIFTYKFDLSKSNSCELINLLFNESQRELVLNTDSTFTQKILIDKNARFEIASYVVWNPAIDNSNVEIRVETSSNLFLSKSQTRKTIDLGVTLVISTWIFITLIQYFRKMFSLKLRINTNKFDYLSISYLIFLIFALHTILDDGLYLIETQLFRQTGVLSQYLYPVPFPVGDWHFMVTSIFLGDIPNIAALRIIPAISLFLIWRIFYNKWLSLKNSNKFTNYLAWVTWSLWAFFAATFLLSLRPEVYVALILTLGLAIIKNYFFEGNIKNFYFTIPLALLALSLHQTGIIAFFLMIPAWLHFIFVRRLCGLSIYKLSFNILLGIYVFFVNSNAITLLAKVQDFEAVNDWPLPFHETLIWNDPPWAEWKRIEHTLIADPLRFTAGLIVVSTIFLLVMFLVKERNEILKSDKLFLISIVIAAASLAFAPSKWVDHYGAMLPLVLVAFVYFFNRADKRYIVIMLIFTTIFSLIALNKNWVAGGKSIYTLDLDNTIVSSVHFLATNNAFMQKISIFLTFIFILLMVYSYLSNKLIVFIVFSASLLGLLAVRQIAPTSVDAVIGSKGWAMNRQISAELINPDYRCGVFSEKALESSKIDYQARFAFATPQDYVVYPCLRPTPIEAGIWIFPDYSVGNLHRWDQQRLMNRMNAETIYCFDSAPRFSSDNFDSCIYKWKSEIPQMQLSN